MSHELYTYIWVALGHVACTTCCHERKRTREREKEREREREGTSSSSMQLRGCQNSSCMPHAAARGRERKRERARKSESARERERVYMYMSHELYTYAWVAQEPVTCTTCCRERESIYVYESRTVCIYMSRTRVRHLHHVLSRERARERESERKSKRESWYDSRTVNIYTSHARPCATWLTNCIHIYRVAHGQSMCHSHPGFHWQYMTDSTDNATPLQSSNSRNSHSSVQIQIESNLQLDLYREVPKNLRF